jgi:hypothetical protein
MREAGIGSANDRRARQRIVGFAEQSVDLRAMPGHHGLRFSYNCAMSVRREHGGNTATFLIDCEEEDRPRRVRERPSGGTE